MKLQKHHLIVLVFFGVVLAFAQSTPHQDSAKANTSSAPLWDIQTVETPYFYSDPYDDNTEKGNVDMAKNAGTMKRALLAQGFEPFAATDIIVPPRSNSQEERITTVYFRKLK